MAITKNWPFLGEISSFFEVVYCLILLVGDEGFLSDLLVKNGHLKIFRINGHLKIIGR